MTYAGMTCVVMIYIAMIYEVIICVVIAYAIVIYEIMIRLKQWQLVSK